MTFIFDIPIRQRILLISTIVIGIFIFIAYQTSIMSIEIINLAISFYGLGVPMLLLGLDTLVDLDKRNVFLIWSTIGLFFLIAYFATRNSTDFAISRTPDFHSKGVNKFISDNWATSLRALPIFLFTYFIFNLIVKKRTGNFIVNTFRQSSWHNDAANREIHWYDMLTTFTLLGIIIIASIIDF